MVFTKKEIKFFDKVQGLPFQDQFDLNVIRKRKASGKPLQTGGPFDITPARLKELKTRGLLKGL
jgi:hypothetical protein